MNREKLRKIAHAEMQKWGLVDEGWTFSFNRALSYAGICYEDSKEIRISGPICDIETEGFLIDTVRHEIAHAKAGSEHGHDTVWQDWAKKVGASTDVTYEESKAIQNARLAKTKYVMCFQDMVYKTYLRKPNANTIRRLSTSWIPGRKKESYGKLRIETYNPKIHTKFFDEGCF